MKAENNDEISSRLYLKTLVSSRHDLCKYGSKHDSILAKANERVPTCLAPSEIPEYYCPKRLGTSKVGPNGEKCRSKIVYQKEENISYDSGVSNMRHMQHSDVSSELIECVSEESVNMQSRSPSPFLKNVVTFEQNNSFLDDGSSGKSAVIVPEAAPSTFDEIISTDCVPWAWSDASSDESVNMELESPPSAQERMANDHFSHSTEVKVSSVEFGVMAQKIVSPVCIYKAKESSSRNRSLKEATADTLWKNMKSSISSSSKEHKLVTVLEVDEKRKRELPMLRSSLPVRTSLLARVEAKKKVDVVDPSITNERPPSLDRTAKSAKPKQTGVMKGPGTYLSPIIIKRKTLASTKIIHLSPKAAVMTKTKSPMAKYRSQMIVSGGTTAQRSKTTSKLEEEKALKLLGVSQAPKLTLYSGPVLNYSKLRSVKNQVDASKVDVIKEKTLHVVDQKLMGVALKSAEQNHVNRRSELPSKALSSRSSLPSLMLASSSSKKDDDGSQMTSDGNGSKKAQIDIGKRRTFYNNKRMQSMTANVLLKDIPLPPGKLSPITSSSMTSVLPSSLSSSSSKDDGDGSKLIGSDVSGSKKTHVVEAKGRAPFYDCKRIQKGMKKISLEDKSLTPEKLSFRSGKVGSLPKEHTDKRRLKFTKAKEASEAETLENEIGKSSFRKSRDPTTESSATLCSVSPAVVLKHQDVQENNTQSLFNDIIEETANKLVEIRKSKVKALVGAFESIISLKREIQ